MFKIIRKKALHETITLMEVDAPYIARKAQPGQFVILRVHENGERIPLTIADPDPQKGTITLIFQNVGHTTEDLKSLDEGESILDMVGPLGVPTEYDGAKRVAIIGGGLGTAIAYPQARALHALGAKVDVILGFRSAELIILEKEMAACSDELLIATDDGSNGRKGLVTDVLKERVEQGAAYDLVIAIGPLIMMKFVCKLTKEYDIRTIVSMNPIMIDGTGMCGCCRVTVGGEMKFACVDGPDFDGHLVDFDEAMRRSRMYLAQEKSQIGRHVCKATGEIVPGENAL